MQTFVKSSLHNLNKWINSDFPGYKILEETNICIILYAKFYSAQTKGTAMIDVFYESVYKRPLT